MTFTQALPVLLLGGAQAAWADVRLDNEAMPQSVWHKMVMPGQDISIDQVAGETTTIDDVQVGGVWTAPDAAGNHQLVTRGPSGEVVSQVTLFVLEPSTSINAKGYLGKYRIGTYPKDRPRGFVRLSKDDMRLPLSPRFTAGQFLCKQQPGEWPKYLLVSESNVLRLETLLSALQADNITQANEVTVMSGFRTPFYNSAIGSAKFSRHMYGDAADIYIDVAPRDGIMDDLNGDGKISKADADFMYDYAQKLYTRAKVKSGGLGSYKANSAHGPFVHVDARGRKARWGR